MTPRLPSREERALWREANRETQKRIAPQEAEEVVEEALPAVENAATHVSPPALPATHRKPPPRAAVPLLGARAAARQFKPFGPPQATLDLHGFSREEAYVAVQQFIARQQGRGVRHVVIITGKGRASEGVLRQNLPHWLNEPAFRHRISAMAHATSEKGGNGVLHVLIKRPHG